VEHDIGALPGKFETDLMSDPCVRAGDQRFFPPQSEFLRHMKTNRQVNFDSCTQKVFAWTATSFPLHYDNIRTGLLTTRHTLRLGFH
jgi:hypothetical protein